MAQQHEDLVCKHLDIDAIDGRGAILEDFPQIVDFK
jgi:hypothetical protein